MRRFSIRVEVEVQEREPVGFWRRLLYAQWPKFVVVHVDARDHDDALRRFEQALSSLTQGHDAGP